MRLRLSLKLRKSLKVQDSSMPLLTVYVEEKDYRIVRELVEKGLLDTPATVIVLAIRLLGKVLHACSERGISKEECLERVVDFVLS